MFFFRRLLSGSYEVTLAIPLFFEKQGVEYAISRGIRGENIVMKYKVFSRGKILNLGHRGFENRAPENTIAAFRLAMAEGADGVELDVHISKDGHLVVIHDPTVDRTTNGSGKVSRMTLAELKQFDAGSTFSPHFAGERIPTLDEVFDALPRDAIVAVELKSYNAFDTVARKVIETIERHRADDRVILLSYNPIALHHCKSIRPDLPVMPIHQPDWHGWLLEFLRMTWMCEPDARAYEWFSLQKHPEWIARDNKKGIAVFSGTTHSEEEMRAVKDLGVVGIITSDPAVLKKILGGR